MAHQYKVFTSQNTFMRFGRRLATAISLAFILYVVNCRIVVASPKIVCNQSSVSLSANELKLAEDAVRGDGAAALQVSGFYSEQGDLSSAEFWATISAEDGGAESEYNDSEYLMNRDDTDSQIRSIFWMQRALRGADKTLARYINLALAQHIEILSNSGDLCIQSATNTNNLETLPNIGKEDKSGLLGAQPLTLRMQALCGDTQAARVLVKYYGSLGAVTQGIYFTTIGAENGDPTLQLKLATLLSEQLSDQESQIRAKFWAMRVLKGSTDPELIASAKSIIDRQEN